MPPTGVDTTAIPAAIALDRDSHQPAKAAELAVELGVEPAIGLSMGQINRAKQPAHLATCCKRVDCQSFEVGR